MKFSKHFKLKKKQAELDFVDIDVGQDTPLYLDPYAIEMLSEPLAESCNEILREFFQEVLKAIKSGDRARVEFLMSNLHEPSDTFLGVSEGGPGRGIGATQSRQIVASLLRSKAALTGVLSDLSDTTLFIDGIARDKISDLVTNLVRRELAKYTQDQCDLHGSTKLEERNAVAPLWSRKHLGWKAEKVRLPIVKGQPILLVPKHFVRHDLALVAHNF